MNYGDLFPELAKIIHDAIVGFIYECEHVGWVSYPSDLNSIDEWKDILYKIEWAFKEVSENYPGENQFFKKVGPRIMKELNGGHVEVVSTGIEIDKDGYNKYHEQIQDGIDLFAKYFQSLWI